MNFSLVLDKIQEKKFSWKFLLLLLLSWTLVYLTHHVTLVILELYFPYGNVFESTVKRTKYHVK